MRAPQRVSHACPGCGAELPPFQALAPQWCPNCGLRFRGRPETERPERPVTVHLPRELPAAKPTLLLTAPRPPCIGNDPSCPCQDGDLCHYRGPGAWPVPEASAPPKAKRKYRKLPEEPAQAITFADYAEAEIVGDHNHRLQAESRFLDQRAQAAGRSFERLLNDICPEVPFSQLHMIPYYQNRNHA